jgi:hypothetical protein
VFGNGDGVSPETIAGQFGHQVMIQALVAGLRQWDIMTQDKTTSHCVIGYDDLQCNESEGWTDRRMIEAAQALVMVDDLRILLGVDPTTIAWMHADARTGAYGKGPSDVDTSAMKTVFGVLEAGDAYYRSSNENVAQAHPRARSAYDNVVGELFLWGAYFTEVFFTNAAYDVRLYAPSLPRTFRAYPGLVSDAQSDGDSITVSYTGTGLPGAVDRVFPFRFYENAGHVVTLRQPMDIRNDVRDWFDATQ